jgi:[acyl-carrier-protein] S-malonyltransferase
MIPAGERLAATLDLLELNELSVPVVTNVEARPNNDHTRVKELLVKQVSAPVLWENSILCMVQSGVSSFIEIGPGKVLSGLVKRINKESVLSNFEDMASLKSL